MCPGAVNTQQEFNSTGMHVEDSKFLHTVVLTSLHRIVVEKPAAFWRKVLWTDKTKMELFDHSDKKELCLEASI